MSHKSSLAVDFLFAMTVEIGGAVAIESGPQGTRVIVNVVSGTFEGPVFAAGSNLQVVIGACDGQMEVLGWTYGSRCAATMAPPS